MGGVFGRAFESLKHDRTLVCIKKLLQEIARQPKLTAATLKDFKQKFINEVRAAGDDPFATFPKKLQSVTYRGFTLEVSVSSLLEHHNMCISSFIKRAVVQSGALEPLFCENELVSPTLPTPMVEFGDGVLADMKNARESATKLVDHLNEISCEGIAAALVSKRAVMCSIELGWRSACGSA